MCKEETRTRMKVMKVTTLLLAVQETKAGDSFIYFTGSFAVHKSIHKHTLLGQRMTALSELARWLEKEKQILLTLHRKEDFLYDYFSIRRKSPPPISPFLIQTVKESQDAFDRNNGLQGLRKIRNREVLRNPRVH